MNAHVEIGKPAASVPLAKSGGFSPAFVISDHSKPAWRARLASGSWIPNLGEDIGSLRWFRGLGTLSFLMASALFFVPDFGPVYGAQPPAPEAADFDEARAQMIMPIAFGSDSGRRMAANEAVVSLAASPERPRIEMTASLGRGDSFASVLQRAGVSEREATTAAVIVARATALTDVEPGTTVNIVLGKRMAANTPRPLEQVSFRARFDLNLEIIRGSGGLQLKQLPIQVSEMPLRIRGTVGSSLYRSARAAGAPASSIQQYLKIISGHTKISSLAPTDEFDIIIEHRRAETGEVRSGRMLYAGVERDGKPRLQLLPWEVGGREQWIEASGLGKTTGGVGRPVNANISSSFGMRRHPILGYRRMHAGVDFSAGHGAPIYAVTDGVVAGAGRMGGCGIAVKLNHAGGLSTRYCHMSRMAVRGGQAVRRGQIIGYVGSTGLSTGAHLHYEVYQNGRAINPLSVKFATQAKIDGQELARYRARLQQMKAIKPGAALAPLQGKKPEAKPISREIEKLTRNIDKTSARS